MNKKIWSIAIFLCAFHCQASGQAAPSQPDTPANTAPSSEAAPAPSAEASPAASTPPNTTEASPAPSSAASTPPSSEAGPTPAATPAPATSQPAAEAPKLNEVPKLSMRWDCGECIQNVKVLPLIEEEYRKNALEKGLVVSATEVAELSITEFRQRPPAARVMLGIFAGKDVLKTKIVFRGKEFIAEDYMANAWLGMNALCAEIARQAIKHLSPASSPQ